MAQTSKLSPCGDDYGEVNDMGFRSLFKRMVGERPQEVKPAVSTTSVDSQPHRTTSALLTTRLYSEPEQAVVKHSQAAAVPDSDTLKLPRTSFAAEPKVRIAVRGISKYGRIGFSGIFASGENVSLDYACGNPKVGKDEIPPRFVYPERIVKRGVQNGVS